MRALIVALVIATLGAVDRQPPLTIVPSSAVTHQPAVNRQPAIERVLIFAFDNTHLEDLRLIPSLWRFLEAGAFSANHHTILPTRSAPGFAAIASGRYADRTGALDNGFFAGGRRESGFTFWETELGSGRPFGLEEPPWQAFNAAGWDVGAVGMNPLVLQTDADVGRLTTLGNPDEQRAPAYQGVAIYHADGTREFGAPNIPWLGNEIGPFPGWPLREVEYPLAATALMQEHGVRITFSYIENLHEGRRPGEYDDVLARYDAAFAAFFARLAADSITPDNSLFVFTTDEGDHLASEGGRSIALGSYLADNAVYRVPAQALELAGGAAANLYFGPEVDVPGALAAVSRAVGVQAVAWGAALRAMHTAASADPGRTPAATVFGEADVQFRDRGRVLVGRTEAPLWNHGTLSPDIETVWLALRGPGIRPGPLDAWTDHVDILPTVQFLLGMPDAGLDGRVIFEALTDGAAPSTARDPALLCLAAASKQLNAPLGTFTRHALAVSTRGASEANTPDGARLDNALAALVDERDALAARAWRVLRDAAAGDPLPADQADDLDRRIEDLISRVEALAGK